MIGRAIRNRGRVRLSRPVVAGVVLCAAAVGLGGSSADEETTVVATVGGVSITVGAVQREMARAGGHDPDRFDELSEKRAALDAVVRAELLARAAIEAGYDKRPEIQDEIKRLLGQRFRADQQRTQSPIRATEEQIQAYYESHSQLFLKPLQLRGSIVFLRSRADAGDEDRQALRQEAESLARDVIAGRQKLVAVARKRSDDRFSRERGGDIGWITPGQRIQRWEQIVLDALAGLDVPGSPPRVVETQRGVYLVQLTDRRGGGPTPLDQARRQIASAIVAEERRERAEAELAELRGRYPLEVDEEQLRLLTSESLTTASSGPPSFPVGQAGLTSPTSDADESGGTDR